MIYLDYNATTPVAPEVVSAMAPFWAERFYNPSSPYPEAQEVAAAVADARAALASLIGAPPEAVVFTGGGTESDNWALWGSWWARPPGRHRLLISSIEHPAVAETAQALAQAGADVEQLPVDQHGVVDIDRARLLIDERVFLVSVMLANNEIGTLQPVAELSRMAHAVGALMHTDAAQAVGKIPVDVRTLDIDLLTVAGHKLYAPKGIGALYLRPGAAVAPLMRGGGQEGSWRSGTENVPAIVGLGVAARMAQAWLAGEGPAVQRQRRDALEQALQSALGERLRVFGQQAPRLPNTLAVACRGKPAMTVLRACPNLRASVGSACHRPDDEGASTVRAMGFAPDWARGLVRLSLGRETSDGEVEQAAACLIQAMAD